MVVRLRLQRFGRTHSPFYRLVAANSKAPRDGKFFEVLGTYNPIACRQGIKEIRLKTDRLQYWISVGAQPSDRVAWILGKFGILPPPPTRFSPKAMQPKATEKK
jgi:small subunit ribosomal protein S16